MDPVDYLLRKFSLVRGLERSVRRLEQTVSDLKGARERLESENRAMRAEWDTWTRFSPLGHFYSPVPSPHEVEAAFARGGNGPPFPGVDLNADTQFDILKEIAAHYGDLPFPEEKPPGTGTTSRTPLTGRTMRACFTA